MLLCLNFLPKEVCVSVFLDESPTAYLMVIFAVPSPQESEESTARNCFVMLFECARERAMAFLKRNLHSAKSFGEQVKLVILDAIRKVCRNAPHEKGQYMEFLLECLESPSNSVSYQAAITLVSLSSSATVIRAAADCLCRLLVHQSDNNIKLIVLDRLQELKKRFPEILSEMVMDLLRGLATPIMDVRRKILDIVLDLVTSRNVENILGFLRKEIQPDSGKDFDGVGCPTAAHGSPHRFCGVSLSFSLLLLILVLSLSPQSAEYRRSLIQTIHQCAVRFPDMAQAVIPVLMDFLSDNSPSALDVILFLRELVQNFPQMRESILSRLHVLFATISSSKVCATEFHILSSIFTSTPTRTH